MSEDFQFIEYESTQIKNELLSDYKKMTEREVAPGSAEYDFISWCAYREIVIRSLINYAGLQNLVNYADLPGLKEIGVMLRVPYSYATPARTTIRYTFSKAFTEVINIPQGNRVSVNGVYFLAKDNLELKIGEEYVDVISECDQNGVIGNGYLPGEINSIVDPLAFLESAINITESNAGTDDENIEVYREKLKNGPGGFSIAGPDEAYRYHTLVAYKNVVDSYITTVPGTGIVKIYPLVIGGIPKTEEVEVIQHYFNSTPSIKPLTDKIEVIAPRAVEYNINVKYWILEGNKEVEKIKRLIEDAVLKYRDWQKDSLGRDITPDYLICEMVKAGAKRVQIISPIFTPVAEEEVAINRDLVISYQGDEK